MSAIYEVQKRKKSLNFNNLQFPSTDMTHFCTLLFTEYKRDRITFRPGKNTVTENIPSGAIVLPIPANLQEVFAANYQGVEMGTLGGLASSYNEVQSGKSLADSGLNLSTLGKKIGATVLGNDYKVRAAEKYLGEVFNPHLTSVFQNVNIRNHQFSWRLSPVSKEESETLKNIIDTVRYKMLPGRREGNPLILGYPAEVQIGFHGGSYDIYPIFKSVVTSLTVNHAAAGTPVFFGETGMPAEIDLQMSFQETEVVLREDVPDPVTGTQRDLTGEMGSF